VSPPALVSRRRAVFWSPSRFDGWRERRQAGSSFDPFDLSCGVGAAGLRPLERRPLATPSDDRFETANPAGSLDNLVSTSRRAFDAADSGRFRPG